jgi:hypothetical protein
MSTVLNDPTALAASIQRITEEVSTPDKTFDLDQGIRSPEDLNRILLQESVRIDREALAAAVTSYQQPQMLIGQER